MLGHVLTFEVRPENSDGKYEPHDERKYMIFEERYLLMYVEMQYE